MLNSIPIWNFLGNIKFHTNMELFKGSINRQFALSRKPAGRTTIWLLCTKTTSSPSTHRIWDCSSSPTSSKFICAVGLPAVSDAKPGLHWKCWLFSQAFLSLWSTCCQCADYAATTSCTMYLNDENLNPTVCFDLWLKPNIHVLRAANHYVLAVVCYAQGHCTALLRSWSYDYAVPQKNKKCLFSIPCVRVGIKFASNRLRMCFFGVWGVGCATANRHSHFNQLTSCSIRFNSRSYASLPDEKLKASSLVMNLVKNPHTKISRKSIIQKSFCALYGQRRAPSMWSAAPASSVLGTFLSPMMECTTSTRSVTSTKEKR